MPFFILHVGLRDKTKKNQVETTGNVVSSARYGSKFLCPRGEFVTDKSNYIFSYLGPIECPSEWALNILGILAYSVFDPTLRSDG